MNTSSDSSGQNPTTREVSGAIRPKVTSGTNEPDSARRVATNLVYTTSDRAERHCTYETSTSDSLVRTESPTRKRSRPGPQVAHSYDENCQDAILRLRLLRLTAVLRPDRVVAETVRTR